MRAFTLLLLTLGTFAITGCPADEPTDPEGDTDTDTDSDTDTDTDTDTDITEDAGDDVASAATFELTDGEGSAANTIGEAGDRDFFFLQPEAGQAMQIWIEAYLLDEDTEPDTVIRLYDADGNYLAENDDYPYWAMGTDSAIYFQPVDGDGFYVEVLEWSDWAGEGGLGDSSFDYDLYASTVDLDSWEFAANEDIVDADAMYDTMYNDPHGEYDWWAWQFASTPESAGYAFYQQFGSIESAGDEDWIPLPVSEDLAGTFYQISLWDTYYHDFAPRVTVYDPNGEIIAQSDTPVYGDYGQFFSYPAAMVFRAEASGLYYVVVEDINGAGGDAGYFYPMFCSPGWSFSVDIWEIEANNPTGLAQSITMYESKETAGFYYAYFAGALDEKTDDSDNFMFRADDVGGLNGKYLSVLLDTEIYGSLLDAKITVYEDLGGGKFEELTSATIDPDGKTGDDPKVWDYELENDNNIYVAIEHENATDEPAPSHFYYGLVYVWDQPVNE